MDKVTKHNFKSVLTVILAFVLSIGMILTVACSTDPSASDSSSSSSSSSSSASDSMVDYQTISNGDFEYRHDSATSFPVSSSIGWSRSNDTITTTAPTSTKSSGIINTYEPAGNEATDEDFNYQEFAKDNGFPVVSGEGDDAVYYNPRTPEYYGLVKADELYDYSQFEQDEITNEDKLPTSGDYVLMIHNASSSGVGTAQKFTSATTISVEKYGKISVWVLTKDLSSKMENGEYGAYISILNTLNSNFEPVIVKNIDTDGKWQKFEFYLESSDLAVSTFRVVLGLGFGSKEVQSEYVEGFAFFDNVHYEEITSADFAAKKALADAKNFAAYVAGADTIDSYAYNQAGDDFNEIAINVDGRASADDLKVSYSQMNATSTITEGENSAAVYTVTFSHALTIAEQDLSASEKVFETNDDIFLNTTSEPYAMDVSSGFAAFNAIASDKIDGVENPVAEDAKTLYLIHNNGASSKVTIKDDDFVVYDGTGLYVTFLTKVKTGTSQSGVTISAIDLGSKKTACEETSALLAAVSTNFYTDEETSDWARVNLFFSNFSGDKFERKFAIKIEFGATTVVQKHSLLTEGYALFTGFEYAIMSQDEFDNLSRSGPYDATLSLGAEIVNPADDGDKTDTYSINYSASSEAKIRNKVVTSIINMTGTVGNGKLVGGSETDNTNENVVAGIINTKYLDNYDQLDATAKANLALLTPNENNQYVQAIIINNKEAASYGYVDTGYTFSSNSTNIVSVKLRVFGDAVAHVYLTDSDPLSSFEILGIEGKAVNRDGNEPVYSETKETAEVYEKYDTVVTAADCDGDWVTVNYVVTAGENSIPYRIEVFNGSREGATSQGLIAIESINVTSSINLEEYKYKLIYDFGESDNDVHKTYKGVVKTVYYTDDEGNDAVKYTSDAKEVEVYTYYANALTTFATYQNIDVTTEIDERTIEEEDETSSSVDEEREANYSLALQITSIILSVVLIAVLLVVVFRQLFKKIKKNDAAEVYYNRSSRDKAQDQINYNKAKREAAAKKREEKAYDYDNPENNVEDESSEEETVEEPVEESVENDGEDKPE